MSDKISNKDKEFLLSLTPDDITHELLVELFARKAKRENGKLVVQNPRMEPHYEFTLEPNEYINKSRIQTTVGRFIFNKFIVEPHFKDILGYVNKTLTGSELKKLDSKLAEALLNDKIDTETFAIYLNKMQWLLMQPHNFLCGSFTMNTLKPHPKVMKEKNRLIKQYQESIEKGDAIVGAKIENQLIELAKKELSGDHGLDLYNSGARGSFGNNYKNIAIMRGPTINPGKGGFDISLSNFMDGIRKEELHIFGNSIVMGAYPKAIGTATSGYFSKQIMAAQQAITTDEVGSDCGSKRYIDVHLTNNNIKDYMYRFIKDGNKLVCLDEENVSKYIGKTVQMRSVMYCISPNGKICYTCTGKLFYLLNIRNTGLTSSRVSSTLLNLSMKKFHDPSIKLYKIELRNMMLSRTFKSPIKESSELEIEDIVKELEEEMNYEDEIVLEAKIPARSNLGFYIASNVPNLKKIEAIINEKYPSLGKSVIASQSKAFASCFGGEWDDEYASLDLIHDGDECTIENLKQIVFTYNPYHVDVNKPCSLYTVGGRFNYLSYKGNLEVVSDKDVRVIYEEQYPTWKEMMIKNGVKLNPMV